MMTPRHTVPRSIRYWILALVLGVLVAGAYSPVSRLVLAKQFLQALASPNSSTPAGTVREQEVQVPGRRGPVRARLYLPPSGGLHLGIVVAHGVHYRGIDERRLVPFARELARSGLVVLTPELGDLADYRLTRASVDTIEDAVIYLGQRKDTVSSEYVGLLGFSFAGGLSLVAASEPILKGKIRYVVSVGGHHDLERVFSFLLTNQIETPTGIVKAKAHDYGLAVVLYGNLGKFTSPEDLSPMRDVVRAWLHEDRPAAMTLAPTLSPSNLALFQLIEGQKLGALAPQLKEILRQQHETSLALSPKGKLSDIGVPVYLLHGAHDSVIPPSESVFCGLELGDRAHEVLVTPLIEHVEVSRSAELREQFALVRFMARLF